MSQTRDQARNELRVYMSRSGLTLSEVAARTGYAHRSLIQFISGSRYGTGEGKLTAKAISAWIGANPLPEPELPGTLYQTKATREMDEMLAHILDGGWGILYGPSGAQKTFHLEYRAAEHPGDIVYIRASAAGMRPGTLLRRVAAWIGAPYAQSVDGLRQSILYCVRRRQSPLALVVDEADALYQWVDTLETLREIGDLARRKVGILVAGNERVMRIFENRRSCYFEKWRGRIEQQELRVLGPSREEATEIVTAEMGRLKDASMNAILGGCQVSDPISRQNYVNMHRLFNTIRTLKGKRSPRAVSEAVSAMEKAS